MEGKKVKSGLTLPYTLIKRESVRGESKNNSFRSPYKKVDNILLKVAVNFFEVTFVPTLNPNYIRTNLFRP